MPSIKELPRITSRSICKDTGLNVVLFNEVLFCREDGKVKSIPNRTNSKPDWRVGVVNTNGYCRTSLIGRRDLISIHRLVGKAFIKDFNEGLIIDHIDGNRSNNHISNLRNVSSRENTYNNSKQRKGKGTPIGIWLNPKTNKYRAQIGLQSINCHLGHFDSIEEAQEVIKKAREKYENNEKVFNRKGYCIYDPITKTNPYITALKELKSKT